MHTDTLQGGQIFDDALCGGGDSAEGITSTASTISAAANKNIKAVIFMGDPRHTPGASFNVGTSTAGGVRISECPSGHYPLTHSSSTLAHKANSNVQPTPRASRATATLLTLTALTATTPTSIRVTARSTVRLRLSLSTPSFLEFDVR